jgi:hypothetical protein
MSTRGFKLTAPPVEEDRLHETIAAALDLLLLPPAVWTCFPAGNVPLPPEYAAKLWRMGMKPGWPDILVLHRWLYGIELKRDGGVLSRTRKVRTRRGGFRMVEGQTEVFPRLISAGMCIAVCKSLDDVIAALGDWQVPMRARAHPAGGFNVS